MKKVMLAFFMVFMMASVVSADTVYKELSGTVYETEDINSDGVEGVWVYYWCGDTAGDATDNYVVTNEDGFYTYIFTDCESDYVTAAIMNDEGWDVKTSMWQDTAEESIIDFYADIDFTVPEFGVVGASLALLGAGYVAYKKRK